MRHLSILICTILSFAAYGQSAKLLHIDASSLSPVQTDAISGVAITKINPDPSKRPCARIKMRINRLTPEEIEGVSVRPVGGSVVLTRRIVAIEGNGLIIELTAKEQTRLYIHHDKYGDSNEVSLNLEGDKEYRLEAMLNTTHSVVVSSNVVDAEVYFDDAYKGRIDSSYTFTVKDIYPGNHRIRLTHGSISKEIVVDVNSSNVYFRIDLDQAQAEPQYIFFQISPKNAKLFIDNKPYFLNAYGEMQDALMLNNGSYNYSVSADGYHSETGTFIVSGAKIEKRIDLRPAHGFIKVPGEGVLEGASVYVDDSHIGEAPLTSGPILSGTHTVRIIKQLYAESVSTITIKDGETLEHKPRLAPDFAKVTIRSADGCDIYVNGQHKGKSPWTGELRSGVYAFQARMDGHTPSSTSITITPDPPVQFHEIPTPKPILGSVNLQSSPSADVYIDNRHIGRTPLNTKVIIGERTISFRKDGFKTVNKTIKIKEGIPAVLKVTLEEGRGMIQSDMTTRTSSASKFEPANCYIISKSGEYSFPTVKGNSTTSVGQVASASVLWESYGTATTPKVGSLIKSVSYKNGYITFRTADTFKEGNAVIGARNAEGKILWSWHIWMTDQPAEQTYMELEYILMDRNLGATSPHAGHVGSLGLLYQWGRKDPFLASSSISNSTKAKSTIQWPKDVKAEQSIDFTVANPTTFIKNASTDSRWKGDWVEGSDIVRWDKEKTIYDPCPPGWKVPDGELEKVLLSHKDNAKYDGKLKGVRIKLQGDRTDWYPTSGSLHYEYGSLNSTGSYGYLWTSTASSSMTETFAIPIRQYDMFSFKSTGTSWEEGGSKANAYSVRCMKDLTMNPSEAIDLSQEAPANCYIVSERGIYKFPTVKGNTRISIGMAKTADVLWESFGTSKAPKVGDLIKKAAVNDGYVVFQTASTFKEGNAVIAAKDEKGNILWSWHIWLTKHPEEQVSENNEVMMDRYLGQSSTSQKEVKEFKCIVYQWGRKDPFLGWTSDLTKVQSTGSWHITSSNKQGTGNIEYAIAHPTTFIIQNSNNLDWWYHYSSRTDQTRWQSLKTAYDPCPPGWKVSDKDVNRSTGRVAIQGVRCVKENDTNPYADMSDMNAADAKDLSSAGSANCYIVSESGLYKFRSVKGNSNESVGNVVHCTLLWETFGIKDRPKMAELVEAVSYRDGYVIFKTADIFKRGNALLAALDDKGHILWSWHIWLTQQPQEHVYNYNAGTMMDRNLGAISAVPGQVGTKGLFYLWGKKDPIFGTSHLVQQATVASPTSTGYSNSNWQKEKTIYDPCPVGWRVPEAEAWSRASKKGVPFKAGFDKKNIGKNMGGKLGPDKVIWYPADGHLDTSGYHYTYDKGYSWAYSCYWSCSSEGQKAYLLHIGEKSEVTLRKEDKGHGFHVRCVKE